MKKVFICGLPASGKGLVRALLDGHPDIITNPFQSFESSLIDSDFDEKLTSIRPYDVLKRMERSPEITLWVNSTMKYIQQHEDNECRKYL